MKSIWIDHIKDKDSRQTHIDSLRYSLQLKQLREILEAREKELTTSLISTPKDGSWPYAQAHLNGRLSDLRETLSLLNFDQ